MTTFSASHGIAVAVDMERACSAHGAGEEAVEVVGCVDEEQQGEQLADKGKVHDGRYQVGAPLKAQLKLAAAAHVPAQKNLQPVPPGIATP